MSVKRHRVVRALSRPPPSAGWAGSPPRSRRAALGPTGPEGRERVVELAHQAAVSAAIDSLPKQLKAFYKAHRHGDAVARVSSPSSRSAARSAASWSIASCPSPSGSCRASEAELKARYGERAEGVGRLPWLVQESYARLVEAMKASDKEKILAESDVLGGLVVDMNSALNLTENFDGQKTGQHGLWVRLVEKLPQAMGKDLKVSPDAANYLDNPKEYVFSMMLGTYVWLDNTLYLEELVRRGKSATATPTSRTSRAGWGPSSRSACPAPPRTRVASGTPRGASPAGRS